MQHDVRAIANFVLDRADQIDRRVTNVHVNKVLYFLYVWYLLSLGRPLVSAKIEAWDYGPVFREVYQEFKAYGRNPINGRARCLNLETGVFEECVAKLSDEEVEFLVPLIDQYLRRDAFDLVELTHKTGTPWDVVYNHKGRSNPGMRITDDLIVDFYARQTRQ